MTARRNNFSDDSLKKEQYQRLLSELRAMIEEGQATDVDLAERAHLLTCSDCGAYEDVTADETLVVYNQTDEILSYSEFIVIDGKQRVFEKKKPVQYLTTYTFICPACGMYQTTIIREKFEEDFWVK